MTPEEYFKKTGKRARRLQSISVNEVSVVDMPATGERFLVLKSKRGGNTMGDELKASIEKILGEGFDVAKISADATKALEEACTLLEKYLDDMPDDVAGAIRKLVALSAGAIDGEPKPKPREGEYPEEKNEDGRLVFLERSADKWPSITARANETAEGNPTAIIMRPAIRKSETDESVIPEDDDQVPFLVQRRGRGLKKSIDSQNDDNIGDDGAGKEAEDLWPSLG